MLWEKYVKIYGVVTAFKVDSDAVHTIIADKLFSNKHP